MLLVFQAMDAAGKDGTIRHVMSGVNPQGCQVYSFKQPSMEELDHDFLWRYQRCLPERGRIGIFNRSYYEEVLVVRVHPELLERQKMPPELVTRNIWKERLEDIAGFERYLARQGTIVLKFFLHVSRKEQKRRFLERLERPEKNWKFSSADIGEMSYVWVPFVALPIFVSLESLDLELLEVSSDLGASRLRTFWKVTFPLSMPGVIAAFVFVFIPTIGEYVTPQLVGGPSGFMFGSAIQTAFIEGFDWQFGSAMAMFLIFAVAVLLAVFGRYLDVRTWRNERRRLERRAALALGDVLGPRRLPVRAARDPGRSSRSTTESSSPSRGRGSRCAGTATFVRQHARSLDALAHEPVGRDADRASSRRCSRSPRRSRSSVAGSSPRDSSRASCWRRS